MTINSGASWQDTYIYDRSGYQNTNYATNPNIMARAWTNSGNPITVRSLIKMDVSTIPAGSRVTSAVLYLYDDPSWTGTVNSGENDFFMERIAQSWNVTQVTWNNQPSTIPADRIWYPASTANIENIQVEIASLVQHWVDDPASNHGLMMKLVSEVPYRTRRYASENYGNSSYRPKLVVTYEDNPAKPVDMIMPDSATLVSFPWYNNNQYLVDYLTARGYYDGPLARSNCPVARYHIPVKMHIYLDGNGDPTSNITQNQAEDLIANVNTIYANAGTGIQFYIDEIEFKNNDAYNSGLENVFDAIDLFTNEQENGVVNVHVVETGRPGAGMAFGAYLGFLPWNCWIETDDAPLEQVMTLAHELGHVFGLLHTHHPGRSPRILTDIFNGEGDEDLENAQLNNRCFQEVVDRNADNPWWCAFTSGDRTCEINGDLLCDTEADPGLDDWQDPPNSGNFEKFVSDETANPACTFINVSAGSDYDEDLDGDNWTPPVHNIMSYTNTTCQNEFTPMQVGVMWHHIEEDFMDAFVGDFSVPSTPICTNGGTVALNNPPPGMSISWTASPSGLIDDGTLSGNGTSAFIKAKNAFTGGMATVTFHQGNNCEFFNTSVEVWVGKPGGVQTDPSGVPAIEAVVGNHITINALSVPGGSTNNLNWWTNDNTALSLGIGGTSCTVECLKSGYYYVYVSGNNSCGEGIYKQIPFDVSSSGGGGECCVYPQLIISPNPADDEVSIAFEDTESMEQYFSEEGKTLQVLITDLSGNEKYRGALNKNGLKVNLKHAQPGIHIVKVSGKDFEQQARLLIE